jgi:alkylation response protein AidB-like acyl-CoA dehydrogenase
VTPPYLAATPLAIDTQHRFALLAQEARDKCAADGRYLDSVDGAAAGLALIADTALELPLPGAGGTEVRWSALAGVATVDVALGRLFEAHSDAVAILAELRGPAAESSQRWAVWAAEGPASTVTATPGKHGWRLEGEKPWCSGAVGATHSLVTADSPEGRGLFAVALEQTAIGVDAASWQGTGLTGTATYPVTFADVPATLIGEPGSYLVRPGFWHGGAGVAATWWGAACGVAAPLYAAVRDGRADPHAAAHLGGVEVSLAGAGALLRETAADIDRDPQQSHDRNALRALRVRSAVEAAADDTMRHVGRALGPAPLCQDRSHARRVADLTLYIRQDHAERDLARVGELAAGRRGEAPTHA